MKSVVVKSDFRKLNTFIKSLSKPYVVKVGIFGDKTGRTKGGGSTNAEIGTVHEYGSVSKKIPMRSFLRMPLFEKSEEIIKDASIGIKELLAKGQTKQVAVQLGLACEKAIDRAFNTGGFGRWKALKDATIRRKGSSRPLIDTSQLRRSITSKVEAA